jgi:protein TonB
MARNLPEKQTGSGQKAAEKPQAISDPRDDIPSPASDSSDEPGREPVSQHAAGGVQPDATYKPDEVDAKPRLLRRTSPNYPLFAQRNNIKGWVILQFVVNTRGLVDNAQVLEAEPKGVFDKAALETAESYKFKPARKNGETVNCLLKQRIRFELTGSNADSE